MTVDRLLQNVRLLVKRYIARLKLPSDALMITFDRREFKRWLSRRVFASLGGTYVYLPRKKRHAIPINPPRIDQGQPKALDVVVAEELVHMRNWIDGDR